MQHILDQLKQIRVQLVSLQSSTNESLRDVDALIYKVITANSNGTNNVRRFPKNVTTKRDKLLHIVSEANRPISAKEVKQIILDYGEELPNVDQSLVNLEADKKLSHIVEDGRKKYSIKNK